MTPVIIITITATNSPQNRQSSRSFSCCLDYYYYLSKNGQYTNVIGYKKACFNQSLRIWLQN